MGKGRGGGLPLHVAPARAKENDDMDMTDTQLDLLSTAHLLAREGQGMVIKDTAYPDAHRLAEQGWLERRFEADGEMSWWWTPRAELTLDLTNLTAAHQNPN